jgi:histidine triad (HIT) family protein
VADGEAAGQEVFHFHLHIIPRFDGDGFGLKMPSGYPAIADRGEFDRIALTIRERLVEGDCE